MFYSLAPKKVTPFKLFIGITSLLLFAPVTLASFPDVPETHPYYQAIESLQKKGVIKGYADGTFQPDKGVSKAEFSALVFRDLGYTPPVNLYDTGFSDVPNNSWFAGYIKKMLDMKIIMIDPKLPYYFPVSNVTRQDALQELFALEGVPAPLLITTEKTSFSDITGTEQWYYLAKAAEKSGIFVPSTDHIFGASRPVTRGDAAWLIYQTNVYRGGAIAGLGDLTETEQKLIQNPKFPILLQVWDKINTQYVNKKNIDETKLIYGAIHGMVESLGDTYSVFLDPDNAASLTQLLNGSYEGIGVILDKYDGKFIIANIIKDSPAEKAGITQGDYLLKVNDQDIKNYAIEDLIHVLQGPAGTTVDLTIQHGTKTSTIKVTRAKLIQKTVVNPKTPVTIPENIGYIAIYQFIGSTGTEFQEALKEVMAKNPKGLILDLRNNPGGYLDTAEAVLEQFIAKDKVLLQIKTTEETGKELSKAENVLDTSKLPIIILVNGNTASSAEIVSGALQDYKMAKLLGEKTFGKGTVQEVNMYQDGALFKLTIAQWLTPLSRDINHKGLTPDITVTRSKDDLLGKTDSQLSRAIKELNT